MLKLLHTYNSSFCVTTRVSQCQKGKTNLNFTEARDSEWQCHQLGRMQVCTLLQTDNHASTPSLFFTGRMPFLPPNQQRQSAEGKVFILRGGNNAIAEEITVVQWCKCQTEDRTDLGKVCKCIRMATK